MRFDVDDGGEEYVGVIVTRHQTRPMQIDWMPVLQVTPHDIGEAQSADTVSSKSRNVADVTKLDLTDLQADQKQKTSK